MAVDTVERARRAAQIRWAAVPPERRREGTHKARIASAVKALVDAAPELTDDQRAKLRAIFAGGTS